MVRRRQSENRGSLVEFSSISLILFLFVPFMSSGQHKTNHATYLLELSIKADLDTNIKINVINQYGYMRWLDSLFIVDQTYRKQLQKILEKAEPVLYRATMKKMKINDAANSAILLKLLKKFGWPCDKRTDRSFKSWIIVWHSDYYIKPIFIPFIKQAYIKGCIGKEFYQNVMNEMNMKP
jgi:hypothetical protein